MKPEVAILYRYLLIEFDIMPITIFKSFSTIGNQAELWNFGAKEIILIINCYSNIILHNDHTTKLSASSINKTQSKTPTEYETHDQM